MTRNATIQKSLLFKIKKEWTRHKYLYLLSIPMILYYIIFHYGPMYGIIMAFQDYSLADGIIGSKFIGFDNFARFFRSTYFIRLITNTLSISIKSIIFGFPAPLILALMLNEVKNEKFKRLVQSVTYMPHFISLVVVCGMLMQFLSRDGLITNLLAGASLVKRVNLLGVKEYFQTIFVTSGIWQEVGWGTIVYLAALSGVDEQLYEAAIVDGANRWKRLLNVTIPSILPTIIMLLILKMGSVMSVGFEKIILLYNEQTYKTADVISSYVYRYGIVGGGFDYGYTTAIGIFQSVINFSLVILANRLSKKFSETSLW